MHFHTSDASLILLCEKALAARPHGGYLMFRSRPILVTSVDYENGHVKITYIPAEYPK